MPCYDADRDEEDRRLEKEKAKKLEAILCGMVQAFGFDHVVAMVDWKKVGVTEQYFRDCWKEHRERDAKRQAAE